MVKSLSDGENLIFWGGSKGIFMVCWFFSKASRGLAIQWRGCYFAQRLACPIF